LSGTRQKFIGAWPNRSGATFLTPHASRLKAHASFLKSQTSHLKPFCIFRVRVRVRTCERGRPDGRTHVAGRSNAGGRTLEHRWPDGRTRKWVPHSAVWATETARCFANSLISLGAVLMGAINFFPRSPRGPEIRPQAGLLEKKGACHFKGFRRHARQMRHRD
jgi:hypothetical protein